MTKTPLYRRLVLSLLCTPLLMLAGCPADTPTSAATPQAATAPTVTRSAQNAAAVPASVSQSTPAQTQVADGTQNTRVQELIQKAESSFNSGVANYRANRLDAARLDFDYAVDSMLSSGLDLQSEGPLADEFERLLNAINSLEMAALKQGNGFSPKIEDAPLESATDLTFPANPELVAKLRTELNITSDLPLVINDQVAGYIGVFSNSSTFRAHMAASLRRAGKYRQMIQRILAEEGVPQDLIYLSVAESGFQPQALNPSSGAGGMWQFMPTGAYGLARNGYFDERFDPEKSTRAYARYIKSLYNQFGDWYLAMAAYDWGPGNIQRAVQRTGYADFWELYRRNVMPAETRAYVPQILAAVIMAKNPERYDLGKLTPDEPVLYDTVHTDYSIDLRLVADVTGSSVPEIVALNPSLLRLTTPGDIGFDLHIPPGTKNLYMDRLKDIPEERRSSWRFHIVKPDETVAGIAAALHARPEDIAQTNGITAADPIAVGDELVIPIQTYASASNPQRYTVHRGDTLVTIADRFNVSLDDLRRWNRLSSSSVKPGRALFVAEPVRMAPSMRGHGRAAARGRGRRQGSTRLEAHQARHTAASAHASKSRHTASLRGAKHGSTHSTKHRATR